MNSSTEIPLRTWTFLNTSSANGGFGSGAAWPHAIAAPSRNTAVPVARIVRFDPRVIEIFVFPLTFARQYNLKLRQEGPQAIYYREAAPAAVRERSSLEGTYG